MAADISPEKAVLPVKKKTASTEQVNPMEKDWAGQECPPRAVIRNIQWQCFARFGANGEKCRGGLLGLFVPKGNKSRLSEKDLVFLCQMLD